MTGEHALTDDAIDEVALRAAMMVMTLAGAEQPPVGIDRLSQGACALVALCAHERGVVISLEDLIGEGLDVIHARYHRYREDEQ